MAGFTRETLDPGPQPEVSKLWIGRRTFSNWLKVNYNFSLQQQPQKQQPYNKQLSIKQRQPSKQQTPPKEQRPNCNQNLQSDNTIRI